MARAVPSQHPARRSAGPCTPDQVYSIDPAQSFTLGTFSAAYVRPSLTVLPYAIANNLPFNLVSSFFISMDNDLNAAQSTSDFFFTSNSGVNLSGHTVLVAWEHKHLSIPDK